ncbi:P-loop containing nucleoside triphosphate hydrolase protein [Pelagophyceae sp. CCMP2097]|nr:P-loop containing nucleoside triphosphate hydrolase protein [Pelagophyceae sp. CCMP2097]
MDASSRIKVVVRVRPLGCAGLEDSAGGRCVRDAQRGRVVLFKGDRAQDFTFDDVLGEGSTADEAYAATVQPLVSRVFDGFNATVMAYGQTGSGKTFTMQDVVRRAVDDVFAHAGARDATVSLSYVEVYNECVYDLLPAGDADAAAPALPVRDDAQGGVSVQGLTERPVRTAGDVRAWLDAGALRRRVGATRMNGASSRSHALCTLTVVARSAQGKLVLVDLAGSERAAKTQAEGARFHEGVQINKGLLALGQCISLLSDGGEGHVPFRDSKLTRLLRDSLGGTARTVFVACASPAACNADETLNTLRYASRAMKIVNDTDVRHRDAQLDKRDGEIAALKLEVAALKLELRRTLDGPGAPRADESQRWEDDDAQMDDDAPIDDDFGNDGDAAPPTPPTPTLNDDEAEIVSLAEAEERSIAALRAQYVLAVESLEAEVFGLERARDRAAAELEAAASNPAAKRSLDALKESLRLRKAALDTKSRELDGARKETRRLEALRKAAEDEAERLRITTRNALAKRVELEKKLRGETAARQQDRAAANMAHVRAQRSNQRAAAELSKLKDAHALEKAALQRRAEAGAAKASRAAAVVERRAPRPADAAGADVVGARLERHVDAIVRRLLVTGAGADSRVAVPYADGAGALQWFQKELVAAKLRLAKLAAARKRSVKATVPSRTVAAATKRPPSAHGPPEALTYAKPRPRATRDDDNDCEDDDDEWNEQDDAEDEEEEEAPLPKPPPRKVVAAAAPAAATDDGAPAAKAWADMTVPQLKEALRFRGLKVGGKKDELLARLQEHALGADDFEGGMEMEMGEHDGQYVGHGVVRLDTTLPPPAPSEKSPRAPLAALTHANAAAAFR